MKIVIPVLLLFCFVGCSSPAPIKVGGYRAEHIVTVNSCHKNYCSAASADFDTMIDVPLDGCSFGKKYKVTVEEMR